MNSPLASHPKTTRIKTCRACVYYSHCYCHYRSTLVDADETCKAFLHDVKKTHTANIHL